MHFHYTNDIGFDIWILDIGLDEVNIIIIPSESKEYIEITAKICLQYIPVNCLLFLAYYHSKN